MASQATAGPPAALLCSLPMSSPLLPETQAALRAVREAPPLFSNMVKAEQFESEHTIGAFKIYRRTDGKFAVADTRRAWNDQQVDVKDDIRSAHARLVDLAGAAGAPTL